MELSKTKNFFLLISILILTTIHCNRNRVHYPYPPSHPQPGQTIPGPVNAPQCQFYQVESLILNCNEESNIFGHTGQQQNTIASLCAKRAFSTVWGTNFTPSSLDNTQNSDVRWWFQWGNIQKGNPPRAPHPIEITYDRLLNTFYNSVNTNRFSVCIGEIHLINVSKHLITASFENAKMGILEPQIFVKCYREELELYGSINACPGANVPETLVD